MKIAWTRMKGVCLLLLGLATIGGGRALSAETSSTTDKPAATAPTAGKATVSPFKDETAPPAKALPADPSYPSSCSSCTDGCATSICADDCFAGAPGRIWFRGEYLLWLERGSHLPPMVSTVTDLRDPINNLQTIYGDREVRNGTRSGYRINFGAWLDNCHRLGVEADYFDLGGNPDNFDSGFSNGFANGTSYPIVRPYYDPGIDPQTEQPIGVQVNAVGYPNQYVGRVTVETGDYFQSAGIWLRRQLRASEWSTNYKEVCWTDPCARTFRLDGIAGYRFSRLIDFVEARDDEMDINAASASYLSKFSFVDSYRASNSFNGGEIGLNAIMTRGRWSLDVVGKVAMGVNNQHVRLYGLAALDPSNTGGQVQQSELTQEFTRNRFSVIPEMTVTVGYQVTDHMKFTVGYDLIYWSAVARSADHIAVEPVTGYPYGSLVGSPLPAFQWEESYFWAQGLRLGGEIRF